MNIYEIVTSNQRRSLKIDQNLLHIPLLSLWVFLSITHHANRMLRAYVQEQVCPFISVVNPCTISIVEEYLDIFALQPQMNAPDLQEYLRIFGNFFCNEKLNSGSRANHDLNPLSSLNINRGYRMSDRCLRNIWNESTLFLFQRALAS
ncbi:hypothetical protein GQR58_017343 [Nymphon striatum]|nr:hypothetical protein GQR58_017343 [Nymphon striatum]